METLIIYDFYGADLLVRYSVHNEELIQIEQVKAGQQDITFFLQKAELLDYLAFKIKTNRNIEISYE